MRNILKQASFLFIAQSFNRVISFFYVIYLARVLGVEQFGLYTVALAYFSIISSFADFGFNRYLIREIAQDHLKVHKLMTNITMLRITLTSILFAIFAVCLYIFDTDKIRVNLILLATLAILPQAIALTFDAVFIALKKLQFSAVALFFSAFLTALAGFLLVNSGFGVTGAVNALIIGQVGYAIFLLILLIKNQGLHLPKVELLTLRKALIGSLPYGLLGILGLLYFRIDAVMLSYLRGSFETGIYGAAYRFLEAVIFIPAAIAAALFPTFSQLHDIDKKEMKRIYYKSLRLMGVLGATLLIGYILILPLLIKLFLPNYLPAIEVIQVLSFAIPFIFLATPGVQLMFASEKKLKTVILLSCLTLAVNIALNFLFIPQFGYIAAAWITVFSDILSFTAFFIVIKVKILK